MNSPYHDVIFLEMVARGFDCSKAISTMMSKKLLSTQFILNEFALSINQLQTRERRDGVDIFATPFIERHIDTDQIFHVFNHPGRCLLAHIGNEALTMLGSPRRIATESPDYLEKPHVPCLPCIAQTFERSHRVVPINGGTSFKIWGEVEPISQEAYFQRAYQELAALPHEQIYAAVRAFPEPKSFLDRAFALDSKNDYLLERVSQL